MGKPLALLDFDGVFNPWPMLKKHFYPPGYTVHRVFAHGHETNGLRVIVNRSHGEALLALQDVVELTWATSWEHDANRLIAPLLGLPELPVIEFPGGAVPIGQCWKRDTVERYVGDRAFVWLDDEFWKSDRKWARNRDRSGLPTLLIPVNETYGVQPEHFEQVRQWAHKIGRRQP